MPLPHVEDLAEDRLRLVGSALSERTSAMFSAAIDAWLSSPIRRNVVSGTLSELERLVPPPAQICEPPEVVEHPCQPVEVAELLVDLDRTLE